MTPHGPGWEAELEPLAEVPGVAFSSCQMASESAFGGVSGINKNCVDNLHSALNVVVLFPSISREFPSTKTKKVEVLGKQHAKEILCGVKVRPLWVAQTSEKLGAMDLLKGLEVVTNL
jgi:hypothetical protein